MSSCKCARKGTNQRPIILGELFWLLHSSQIIVHVILIVIIHMPVNSLHASKHHE